MTLSFARLIRGSVATASLFTLLLATGGAAQVATLGDPEEGEPTPAPVAEELAGQEAMLAFVACLRDNGIDIDDPRFGLGGLSFGAAPAGGELPFDPESPESQAAMEVCGSFLEAMLPEFDVEQEAEIATMLFELSVCMRDRGWADFPDLGGGEDPMAILRQLQESGLDLQDPAFEADATACQAESGMDRLVVPGT